MKPLAYVYSSGGYLYYYDEDETIEVKVDYKVIPGYKGDRYSPPEPAELDLLKIIYVKENGKDISFDEKEIWKAIDNVDLSEVEL